MKYCSTRGGVRGFSFEDALLSGYAADGGLLMPESIPALDAKTLQSWAKCSYVELVKSVISLFVSRDEISEQDLNELLGKAFSRFATSDVVKLARLGGGLNILELHHGPTLAFKDLALSCVGQFLEYFLEKRKRHITILVGTSGDTGSAAIESVRGLKWVDMVVLLPKGRCSRVQELQMTTVLADNVHVFRVEGTSDDLDLPIKRCFTDSDFAQKHHLCSINSINWARIMVQVAHYFYAYFQLRPQCDGEVEIVVPTGACGNVTGGVIAKEMGLPIRLVCAVTNNDIVARTVSRGDYSVSDTVLQSLAPSMGIQVPYNIERILYLFSGGDTALVNKLLVEFESEGKMQVPDDLLTKVKAVLRSFTVSDDGIRTAMGRCWREFRYLLCPHSAVAVSYGLHVRDREAETGHPPQVCVATASAAKFEEAVTSAGLTPQPTAAVAALDAMATRYVDMKLGEDWDSILRGTIEAISRNTADLQ